MTGRMYLGPVRDMEHAGWLQSRFEGDSHSTDDMFGDTLDASVTVFCLRELAHYLGHDTIGDAGTDALFEAFSEDGVSIDSHDAATEWLERHYPKPADWLDALKTEAERVTKRRARDDAKRAVMRFVEQVMP
jgi:hypothetical protein